MLDWTKLVTEPLTFAGFVLFAVFLIFALLAKLRRGKGRCWLSAAAAIMAVVAVATGLSLAQPGINLDPSLFRVQNYGGKCLDYGQPRHHPHGLGLGPTVYLNDCALAHPVRVEEINDNDRHEVILHAGTKVLGITKPPVNVFASGLVPTEFALELQDPPDPIRAPSGVDQVFALDGDSIILASSRPCINTDDGGVLLAGWRKLPGDPTPLCPPPPPQLVIQIQNAHGANGSPLVVGPRNLDDAELWDFKAADNSDRDPTTGFKRVTTSDGAGGLWDAICNNAFDLTKPDEQCHNEPNSGWGRVIKIEPAAEGIDLGPSADYSEGPPPQGRAGHPAIYVPSGITIRGDRRGTNLGPQISALHKTGRNAHGRCAACTFEIHGDYVRITGLRLRGDSRETDEIKDDTSAIQVDFPGTDGGPRSDHLTLTEFIAIIDHNDISDWEEAAVFVPVGWLDNYSCPVINDPATLGNVRIERNFLHHNERWSGGYGVNVGGRAAIIGNTFLMNRHAIAAGGEAHNEYRAWYNLVLSNVPVYSVFVGGAQQDFDMHGTGAGGYGDNGGYSVDIAGNTFLGGNRFNFELRGHPCSAIYFRDNVTQRAQDQDGGGVINFHKIGDPGVPFIRQGPDVPQTPVSVAPDLRISEVLDLNNQFANSSPGFSDPTVHLGVGDFDGDGVQDLFLATGTAWYYSPGGVAEWRFLSAKTDKIDTLLFGDFDGDGRTDVFTQIGDDWMVSWSGVSPWEKINHSQWRMTDFYIGDFVGDRSDDVFFARGDQWFVSDGGRGPFVPYATSSFKLGDLAFGHFDYCAKKYGNNEKVDVVGVVANEEGRQWMVVCAQAPEHKWESLRPALTDTMKGLSVAHFGNNNGSSDIVRFSPIWDSRNQVVATKWEVSRLGMGDWEDFTSIPVSTPFAAVGRFDETKRNDRNAADDILVWDGLSLNILSSGTGTAQRHSRQEMH